MASVNKAILIGNLGRDPEVKRTPSGTTVATFSIATTETWNDKSGSKQEKTEWHNIVAWGKLGELAGQYLKKGRPVYIEGRIETRSWEDQSGVKKYKTEIVANQMQFLGSKDSSSAGSSYSSEPLPPEPSIGSAPQVESQIEDDLPF